MPPGPVYAIVLAAGKSARFGSDKLLAEWHGKPVLAHVLEAVRESQADGLIDGGLLITRGGAGTCHLAEEYGLMRVDNPCPEAGLSRSLQLGINTLVDHLPAANGALIFAGDQPGVRVSTIGAVVAGWHASPRPVARPRYLDERDTPGHPVLLGREVWKLVSALDGDAGFGAILKTYPELVAVVDVPGTNPDIDTPDDLHRLAEDP